MSSVYVNRILNMKKIKAIGFDMDHTLVRYHSENFEHLAYKVVLEKLVSERQYPKSILKLECKDKWSIRGLVIDKQNGNILKVNNYERIKESYHGTRRIDFSTQNKIYKGTVVDLNDNNYASVDTAFDIAHVVLFAQIVDLKDQSKADTFPSYRNISDDIKYVLDIAHQDGSLKDKVKANLSHYIRQDPDAVTLLERYRKCGKMLFILTNSDFSYTKLLMDYACNPFLKNFEKWEDLFTYVLTSSRKPDFFYGAQRFLRVDPNDGKMVDFHGPLDPGFYFGGSADVFQKSLNLAGQDILYVGDHIFGDIVRLKKLCDWRTALVIEELNEEVERHREGKPLLQKIAKLMSKKTHLERELDDLFVKEFEDGLEIDRECVHAIHDQQIELDKKISEAITAYNNLFNPLWGEVMRAGNDQSRYAMQVERYACIYMSRVGDLLQYSPRIYFRPIRRSLPHELRDSDHLSAQLDEVTQTS